MCSGAVVPRVRLDIYVHMWMTVGMKIPGRDDAKGPVSEAVDEKMIPIPRQFSGGSIVNFSGSI